MGLGPCWSDPIRTSSSRDQTGEAGGAGESVAVRWPVGDSEMARRVRELDWAGTALGPVSDWPVSLRAAVDLVLGSPAGMIILWGPDLVQIYNDGYRDVMGAKHPAGLGQPTRVCWPEVWHFTGPVYAAVMRGESRAFKGQVLVLERTGVPEDARFDLGYSPLRDDDGVVAGVLATVSETTAQEKLREADANYRVLFDSIDQGFCTIEMIYDEAGEPVDYRILDANAAFERQTGLDGAIGRTIKEFVPQHENEWFRIYGRIARTREPERFEHVAAQLGRHYEVYAFPIGRVDERRVGVLFNDVSARKRAEQAIRDSERRFSDLAESMPQLVWTADADGRVDYYNDRVQAFAGVYRAEDGKWRWAGVVHPDDLAATMAAWSAALTSRQDYQITHRLVMRDGSVRWHLSRARPVCDPSGAVTRWFGTATDVHVLRMAQERLHESEQRQRIAAHAARLGIFEWRIAEDVAVWKNERAYEIFGHTQTDGTLSRQQFCDGYLHPQDVAVFDAALAAAQENGGAFDAVCRITRKSDGELRWIELAGQLTDGLDGAGQRLVGVVADITARKRAEAQRQLLVDELNHRVKNTLAVVQSIAQQTFKSANLPELTRTFQSRLTALAAAHSLLTRAQWDQTSLTELTRETAAAATGQVDRIRLDGPHVPLDPKKAVMVAMAIHELCTNAVKYGALSTETGHIEVTWSRSRDGELHLVWQERGGPPVVPPTRKGFGSRMIEQALAHELAGRVRMEFHPDGLVCTIEGRLDAMRA